MLAEKYHDSRMMTLKKISHLSGYSTSTVSKALNGGFDINVNTQKLIRDIACQYNYTPNRNAIALRKSKTNIIAVILPQVNNQLYGDLLFNIQKRASQSGYRIMLYQSFENKLKENEFLEEISDGSSDAAIFITKNGEFRPTTNLPIVCLQVKNNQPEKDLLERFSVNFENLLKRIK